MDDDDALDCIRARIETLATMGGQPGRIWRRRRLYHVVGLACIGAGAYLAVTTREWGYAMTFAALGVLLANTPEAQRDAYLTGGDDTLELVARYRAEHGDQERGPDD